MRYKKQAPINLALFLFCLLAQNTVLAKDDSDHSTPPLSGDKSMLIELIQLAKQPGSEGGLAQLQLGQMYQYGDGVKQNNKLACDWFVKSAQHHIPLALQEVGHCFANDTLQPRNDAIEWYQKAMQAGLSGAQCDIGVMYFNAQEGDLDKQRGIRLCTLAAQAGAVSAQAQLGRWFMDDKAVQDIQQAQHWLEQAAPYHGESAFRLAELIEKYSTHHNQALYWFETSASLGYLPAYTVTGQAYYLSLDKAGDKQPEYLAKAYIWSQAWQRREQDAIIPEWMSEVDQQTPTTWKQQLDSKVSAHLQKLGL